MRSIPLRAWNQMPRLERFWLAKSPPRPRTRAINWRPANPSASRIASSRYPCLKSNGSTPPAMPKGSSPTVRKGLIRNLWLLLNVLPVRSAAETPNAFYFCLLLDVRQLHKIFQTPDIDCAGLWNSRSHRLSLVHRVCLERRPDCRECTQAPDSVVYLPPAGHRGTDGLAPGDRYHAGTLPVCIWSRTITRIDGAH